MGGKQIDPKPAVAGGAGPGMSKDPPCKKIFVGGLDTELTQEEIAEHFSQYGKVWDILYLSNIFIINKNQYMLKKNNK